MPVTVDICVAQIAAQSAHDAALLECLAEEDIVKLHRITKAAQRRRFIATRAFLRQQLASYTGQTPAEIHLARSEHGKPYLPDFPHLKFNLSHSGDSLLLAVCGHAPLGLMLGVDVEIIRPRPNLYGVVKKCFSAQEAVIWQQLESERQCVAFFQSWTAKEAFAKAVGRGLAIGLQHIEIQHQPKPRVASIPEKYGKRDDWQLYVLDIDALHSATLCVNSPCLLNHHKPPTFPRSV